MIRVKSLDFEQSPADYCEKALQELVIITKEGNNHLVLLSAAEHARLSRRDRRVGSARDMPERAIIAFSNAEVPEEYNYLDSLMDN